MILNYILQGQETLACCRCHIRVYAEVFFQNGSTTTNQEDVRALFMVDVKEMKTDLTLERVVRMPVYVVSSDCTIIELQVEVMTLHALFITDRCTFQPETGPCEAYIPSYFYNKTSGNCEQFIYGGCGGNDNRFTTAAECVTNCSTNGTFYNYLPTATKNVMPLQFERFYLG